jgi:tetratricopeptide (TPR) repeat protein
MGSINAAERFIQRAAPKQQEGITKYEDFLVRALFYLSLRLHDKALQLIDEAGGQPWMRYRIVNIIHAVALNRSRHHVAADALIEKLLRSSESREESALLAAYRLAGMIHSNNIDGAKAFFDEVHAKLSTADNFGYLLRNAASAFSSRRAIDLLSRAVAEFDSKGDRFGYATALSNRAMSFAFSGDLDRASRDAHEAHDLLEIFGVHHMHIITNNMGIISIRKKNYADAEKLLWRALTISRTSMPTIFAKINLAALYAFAERFEESLRLLRDLKPQVEVNPVDRVRQKYYINAAAIMALADASSEEVRLFCENALLHPDRKNSKTTQLRVDLILTSLSSGSKICHNDFRSLFWPCSLSYWYQNPIEGLPSNILTSKAVV